MRDPEKAATDTGFAQRKHLSRTLEKICTSVRGERRAPRGTLKGPRATQKHGDRILLEPRTVTLSRKHPVLLSRYSLNHQGG